MNIFTLALEMKAASKSVDVFTPTPRNWKELERPGDVFSLALEMQTASKSGRLYHPNS